jgi:hypothetical protein
MTHIIKMIIKYDINGNIYINDNWIYIDKNNDIKGELMKCNIIDIIDEFNIDDVNIKQIKKDKVNNMLRTHTIDELVKNYEEDVENRNDEDEDYVNSITNYKLCPEDKLLLLEEKNINDPDDMYDENIYDVYTDVYYDIYKSDDDIEMCDNGFGLSNYECIVIKGDLSSNNVIFKTDIINDSPSYRIMIYDNHVKLNIIGSMIKTYEIIINSDKQIEFKNIDLKYVF